MTLLLDVYKRGRGVYFPCIFIYGSGLYLLNANNRWCDDINKIRWDPAGGIFLTFDIDSKGEKIKLVSIVSH
jgi:hypothetical protein